MMFSLRDDGQDTNSKIGSSPSTTIWLCLIGEFLIGGFISALLFILGIIKSLLPKPPRDLTNNVVLVAGVSSSLGESLAEEFAKSGCSVICVDNDLRSVEEIASRLRTCYPRVEEIPTRHKKDDSSRSKSTMVAYSCDLMDQDDIRKVATKVTDEVGRIDVLVTCVGNPNQDIFDTASRTLMSHYWTVLAFLPSMLKQDRAYVVGVTPVTSRQDGYLGSRAAIASLMESLGQELSNQESHLTFLAVSPVVEHDSTTESEQQLARDVVEAVKRDQGNLSIGWVSKTLYRISCVIYNAITVTTQWIYTQGCDNTL